MKDDLIKRSDAIGAFVAETNGVDVEKAIKVVDAYLQIRECDEVWDSIRAIRDCLECAKDEIAEYIPSADRPQEWTPCSERLPEVHEEPYYADHEEILHESDHVLTCCKHGKGFVYAIGSVIHDEVCDSYEWSDLYDYADREIDDMQVLAWMPLPEPWRDNE